MARVIKAGYDAKAVAEFLIEQIEFKETTRGNHGGQNKAAFLNGERMSPEDQRRVHRWANESVTADLAAVDRVLIRYDLALWEFEHWAEQRYGTSTFFDTATA